VPVQASAGKKKVGPLSDASGLSGTGADLIFPERGLSSPQQREKHGESQNFSKPWNVPELLRTGKSALRWSAGLKNNQLRTSMGAHSRDVGNPRPAGFQLLDLG